MCSRGKIQIRETIQKARTEEHNKNNIVVVVAIDAIKCTCVHIVQKESTPDGYNVAASFHRVVECRKLNRECHWPLFSAWYVYGWSRVSSEVIFGCRVCVKMKMYVEEKRTKEKEKEWKTTPNYRSWDFFPPISLTALTVLKNGNDSFSFLSLFSSRATLQWNDSSPSISADAITRRCTLTQ